MTRWSKRLIAFAMAGLALASCGGSEDPPQADSPPNGGNGKQPESAATTKCDALKPAKVAEITGYPVAHVSEGSFAFNDTDGQTWMDFEDDLPDCGYFTKKAINNEAVEVPYVHIQTTAKSEAWATPEDMKCPNPPRSNERCQEVQGVGDHALLTSSPVEDEPAARGTELKVVASGKVFNVNLRAQSTEADDVKREEAARRLATAVLEAFGK